MASSGLLQSLHSLEFSLGHVETKPSPSQYYENLGVRAPKLLLLGVSSPGGVRGELYKTQLGLWSGLLVPRARGGCW